MPIGSPKPQTVATKKYEKKAGWVSKSYKLKKEVVDEYAEACKKAGKFSLIFSTSTDSSRR